LTHTSWRGWREQHPDTTVLSTSTGYNRGYTKSPYAGYEKSNQVFFPVTASSQQFDNKEWVLGVNIGETYKAYPFSELKKSSGFVNDVLSGRQVRIVYDRKNASATIIDEQGKEIPAVMSFWFAWYAFYPDTEVYLSP